MQEKCLAGKKNKPTATPQAKKSYHQQYRIIRNTMLVK
jgi:hypothetical protein